LGLLMVVLKNGRDLHPSPRSDSLNSMLGGMNNGRRNCTDFVWYGVLSSGSR
jgi:hypothetical protein